MSERLLQQGRERGRQSRRRRIRREITSSRFMKIKIDARPRARTHARTPLAKKRDTRVPVSRVPRRHERVGSKEQRTRRDGAVKRDLIVMHNVFYTLGTGNRDRRQTVLAGPFVSMPRRRVISRNKTRQQRRRRGRRTLRCESRARYCVLSLAVRGSSPLRYN